MNIKAGCDKFVIGHRGASSSAPENTIPSFLNAIEFGVDFIELDVWGTRDGELAVIHDGRVDRTTDSRGLVSELTLEELKALDAGAWFAPEFRGAKIPTLEEVLTLAKGKVSVAVDIKEIGIEGDIVRTIREKDMVHDSMILTGDVEEVITKIREIEPMIPIQTNIRPSRTELGGRDVESISDKIAYMSDTERRELINGCIDELLENLVNIASVEKGGLLIEDLVRLCHKRGLLVNAWPINEIDESCACIKMGVDFITTDNPQLVIRTLHEVGYR